MKQWYKIGSGWAPGVSNQGDEDEVSQLALGVNEAWTFNSPVWGRKIFLGCLIVSLLLWLVMLLSSVGGNHVFSPTSYPRHCCVALAKRAKLLSNLLYFIPVFCCHVSFSLIKKNLETSNIRTLCHLLYQKAGRVSVVILATQWPASAVSSVRAVAALSRAQVAYCQGFL